MKPLLRALGGLLAVSAAAAVLFVPQVELAAQPQQISPLTVSVDPKPLQLSCPGPFVEVGGSDGVEIGSLQRIGEASVSLATSEQVSFSPLISGFSELVAEGTSQSTSLLSATQSQYVERQRARGLTAAFCEQPSGYGWFVSGQSSVGAETVMLLSNPNPVDTVVSLNFHLPGGVVNERIALAKGSEELVSLASVVGLEPVYAIEYSSVGAAVSVALQHRFSRGLTPLGLSLSTAVSEPKTEQWITPVEVFAEGYQAPLLRLFAPGERAEVIITAFSASEPVLYRSVVPAGAFLELPLELANGLYALRLESDEPVLAAVLNPSLEPLDHSWIYPAESFAELTLAISGYQTQLAITNPTALGISVRVTTLQAGRESIRSVQLEPLSVSTVPVSGDSVSLVSASQFFAALQIADPLGYAVVSPSENRNLGSELEILVR